MSLWDTVTSLAPVAPIVSTLYHEAKGVYDVATGNDKGALKEDSAATIGAAEAFVPGMSLVDMAAGTGVGMGVLGGEYDKPQKMSDIVVDELADKTDLPEHRDVSTLGQIGAAAGGALGLAGAPFLGPLNAIPMAEGGRETGEMVSSVLSALNPFD
jgi:hypothetical protein